MRKILGTITGLVFAPILVNTLWLAAFSWFPPAIPDDASEATARAFVMAMPLGGHITIAIGWFLSGLISAYAGLRVAQWRPAGWIVAAALIVLALFYWTQMVQPVWLQLLSVALPAAGAWLAERHFHRARRGDPLIN